MNQIILASILLASTIGHAATTAPINSLADDVMAHQDSAKIVIQQALKTYTSRAQLPPLTYHFESMRCLDSVNSDVQGDGRSGVCTVNVIGFQINADVVLILQRHAMFAAVIYVDGAE